LDKIRKKHPIVNLFTQYRELKKLRGTYSEKLPMHADQNGYIYTSINNTKTATGRLSSSEPNLQNIPMRTETGRKIKKAFIAPEGCVILSSDYSQIEMRLTAHDSQDPIMTAIFNNGEDIHTKTAAWIFGVKEQDVDPMEQRHPCKRTGFGIIYDISDEGLSDQLLADGVVKSSKDCGYLKKEWFKIYKGVKRHMEISKYKARTHGRVYDFCGRYRLLPGAKSNLSWIRNEAFRQAVNVPAQSGAGQIIKEAMRQLLEFYTNINTRRNSIIVQPVMQIHDDLLHYVRQDSLHYVADIIKVIMENAIQLSIPVKVDQKYGHNWLEMEKIK
jgi:DNA polymerase-1